MSQRPRLCVLWLLLLLLPVPAFAQHGLSTSLTTSGYLFQKGADASNGTTVQPASARKRADGPPEAFTASASLTNLSNGDIAFQFPNPVAAARHWTFRVFDVSGTQVWVSEEDQAAAALMTAATLRTRGTWRRTLQVPLKINGTWLAAGRYTLEASVAGSPPLGSTVAFEVIDPNVAAQTGIKGQVTTSGLDPVLPVADATTTISFGSRASLSIVELRDPATVYDHAPFTWFGSTDDLGHYQVGTPAGRFTVTATRVIGMLPLDQATAGSLAAVAGGYQFPTVSNTVTVVTGQFTTDDLLLPPGHIITWPVYPEDTGVTGTVAEAATDGNSPAPLAGATVRLLANPVGPIIRPVLDQTTASSVLLPLAPPAATTDGTGHFTIHSYPGSYRLVVYRNVMPGVYQAATSLPVVSVNLIVTAGQISSVSLQATAPVPSGAVDVATVNKVELTTLQLNALGSAPQTLLVATGATTTGGWTSPALRPRPSSSPYVIEFDLVAVPPVAGSAVTQAFTPVSASVSVATGNLSVIRVYAATNSKELDFALPLVWPLQAP